MTSQTHFLRRSELLVFLAPTFFVPHKFIHVLGKRIPTTFLGHHLIGTYDLLISAGCDMDVATAGALHSLYGTDAFTRTTIPPNLVERRKIRQQFGERAEKLAFLFHACNRNDHPKNIEMGRLFDRRCGVPLPGITVEDVQALRLIEAANMIEQGASERMIRNLPTVYEAWQHQLLLKSHQCALGEPPPNHTQLQSDTRGALMFGQRLPSFLLPPSPVRATAPVALSLMVFAEGAEYGHEHWMSIKTEEDFHNIYATFLDILQKDQFYRRGDNNQLVAGSPDGTRRVLEGSAPLLVINKQTDGASEPTTTSASRKNNGIHAKIDAVDESIGMTNDNHSDDNSGHTRRQESMRENFLPHIVFCLRGEASFGMPWTPLWMLLRFVSRMCGRKPSMWKNFCRRRRSLSSSREGTLEIEIRYLQEHESNDISHLPPCLIAQEQLNRVLLARGGIGVSPPAIAYHALSSSGRLSSMAAGHVIDSLRSFGYAIISMDDAATLAIARSFDAVLRFQANVPLEEKRKFVRFFDNSRYVGWARDPAREWLQLRARDGGNDLDDGDGLPMPWPPSIDRDDCRDMMNAVNLLTVSAEKIFEEIGVRLNLGTRQYLRRLCRSHPTTVDDDDVNLSSPGPSVCRLFVYLDKAGNNNPGNAAAAPAPATAAGKMPSVVHTAQPSPPPPFISSPGHPNNMRMISASGAHADMGLLTLSPASTIPALNLLHPQTQITLQPEMGLAPNEWVLFAGETLSFLTGGALQAPIHSVPFIDRHEVARTRARQTGSAPVVPPLRRSMPLFLRAVPEAHLFPLSRGVADMAIVQVSNEVRTYVPPPPVPAPPSLDRDHDTESLAMPLPSESFDATAMLSGSYVSENNNSNNNNNTNNKNNTSNNNNNRSVGNGGLPLTPSNTLPMSSRAMTCRDFTVNHALGMRPWRLGSGTDF